ncbi:MAG: hypothetical protein J6Y02_10695 [Pseudobutyrivibrio sp.]|nr:hypothetical protein [Pseudobutyrivibrio sp.]
MKLTFKINAELTINDLELGELECVHNHEHKDNNKNFDHYCVDSDDNSLGSLKGSAALKFDCDLSFDMSPEEMKSCYNMIESIGGKFAETARKTKDLGERVIAKINQTSQQPKEPSKESNDEQVDLVDVSIRIKDALRRAERNIEENESDSDNFKIDLTDLRTASRLIKEASELAKEHDLCFKYEQRIEALRKRLASLNEKC